MNLQHKAVHTCFTLFVAVKAAWANIPYLLLVSEARKEEEGQRVAEREWEGARGKERERGKEGQRERREKERDRKRKRGREKTEDRNREM